MSWRDRLKHWLHGSTMHAHLSAAEAVAIARAAAAGQASGEELALAQSVERNGRLVWVVRPASVGRTLQVTIDDRTREVIEVAYTGLR